MVFIVLAYPASVRKLGTRIAIVGAVSAFVSFAYLLTMVLDYPFAGDVLVDTSPYKTEHSANSGCSIPLPARWHRRRSRKWQRKTLSGCGRRITPSAKPSSVR